MVHTLTVLTLDLATAIGLYWIAAGIGLWLAPERMRAMVDDLVRVPGLTYGLGLAQRSATRILTLAGPNRLVIDLIHA